jgi:hypothetical protein
LEIFKAPKGVHHECDSSLGIHDSYHPSIRELREFALREHGKGERNNHYSPDLEKSFAAHAKIRSKTIEVE